VETTAPSHSFPALLDAVARERPDDVAYIWLGEGETPLDELTFGELRRRALTVASALSRVAAPGERAVVVLPQGLKFLVTFFGCLYAGVVPVPVTVPNRKRGQEVVRNIAADAGATLLLTGGALLEQLAEVDAVALGSLRTVDVDTLDGAPEDFVPQVPDMDAVALLQYTSGSTRSPRGVVVTHRNLAANHRHVAQCLGSDESTVYVSWLPMFHDMGLGIALQAVWLGVRCVLMSPRAFFQEPLRWLRVISAFRGTTSGGPNSAFALCVQRAGSEEAQALDLSSWRTAFNGSEPVHAATLERFARAFAPRGFRAEALQPVYGLAEATLLAASEPPGRGAVVGRFPIRALEEDRDFEAGEPPSGANRVLVSCGGPWPGTEIVIVRPGTRRVVPSGQSGEVWIRGPSVSPGYWNQPEETRAHFGLRTEDGREGFVRSGDLGTFAGGRLFLLGRQADVLNLGGRRHYPHDLELTSSTCHQALAPYGCAAVKLSVQGTERLLLLQEVARTSLRRLDAADVMRTIRRAIAEHHGLAAHGVVLLKPSTLPRTTSGKVRRARAREGFLHGVLPVIDSWFEPTAVVSVSEVI
jgi:acyl-CoA synthetase (AMP-forming)/AMP-acid ligase II